MIVLNGTRYYSILEAAKETDIPYTTLFRWVTKEKEFGSIKFDVAQDSISKRYFIAGHSVKALAAYLKQHVVSVQRIQTHRVRSTARAREARPSKPKPETKVMSFSLYHPQADWIEQTAQSLVAAGNRKASRSFVVQEAIQRLEEQLKNKSPEEILRDFNQHQVRWVSGRK